jgi:hypothetical protein
MLAGRAKPRSYYVGFWPFLSPAAMKDKVCTSRESQTTNRTLKKYAEANQESLALNQSAEIFLG